MDKYYSLLGKRAVLKAGFKSKEAILNLKIKSEEKLLHKKLVKEHKFIFRMLDVFMVVIILMNLGALVMTNMMVAQLPNIVMLEVNPVAAQVHNLQVHPEASAIIKMVFKQMFFWILIISIYLYTRLTAYKDSHLWILGLTVLTWIMILGMDFFNNFGFLLGKIIYGGMIL